MVDVRWMKGGGGKERVAEVMGRRFGGDSFEPLSRLTKVLEDEKYFHTINHKKVTNVRVLDRVSLKGNGH